jgi:hypothetical protein
LQGRVLRVGLKQCKLFVRAVTNLHWKGAIIVLKIRVRAVSHRALQRG